MLLVGDNPFQGVGHLSQQRTRSRDPRILEPEIAANLVDVSLQSGANGFMFSINEETTSILRILRERGTKLRLFALTPAAYEYIRHLGPMGFGGLAMNLGKRMVASGDLMGCLIGLRGAVLGDIAAVMESFLRHEITRVRSSSSKNMVLESLLLHEVIVDIGLALNLKWLFDLHIDLMRDRGIVPGFETRNFAYLITKLREWTISPREILIAAPFNKVGFQMNPSKATCEETLRTCESRVVAMSILAAGYLSPIDAVDYLQHLPNLAGAVVGISKEKQARETFGILARAMPDWRDFSV